MKKIFLILCLTMFSVVLHAQPIKVVYHITEGIESAAGALSNITNHLNADSTVKIVVVSNGAGIDFLLQDAKDIKGREFSSAVSTLVDRGVDFRVCQNTLNSRKIAPDRLLMEAKLVIAGMSEVARLQAREGYVYIKP